MSLTLCFILYSRFRNQYRDNVIAFCSMRIEFDFWLALSFSFPSAFFFHNTHSTHTFSISRMLFAKKSRMEMSFPLPFLFSFSEHSRMNQVYPIKYTSIYDMKQYNVACFELLFNNNHNHLKFDVCVEVKTMRFNVFLVTLLFIVLVVSISIVELNWLIRFDVFT